MAAGTGSRFAPPRGRDVTDLATVRSDRAARAFVAAAWLVMVAVCAWCWIEYERNIPITEDWLLVPGLTGHDPHFWRSLWAQNNEHRVPFPQLVLQGVLRLARGDFRAGMIFNVAIIAAMAAALAHLARTVRGRASYADAFFPIAFLHLGNWENLFWSWQATQIIPALLGLVVLYLLIRTPRLASTGAATVAALTLVALPLSGANGLFFVPFFGGWFCYCAWRLRRRPEPGRSVAAPVILVAGTVAAAIVAGLYFVGYERPAWTPPNPGPIPSLAAGVRFLALGWGPAARSSWIISGLGVLGALGAGLFVCLRRLRGLPPEERHRALGMLAFTGAFLAFGLVVGWGRAGVIVVYGSWPLRYSLIALPALVVAFFLWTLYAPAAARERLPALMMAAMVAILPINTVHGFWWAQWYRKGTTAVLKDLQAGNSAVTMVKRHRAFLHHSRDEVALANEMVMLKAARMGPWVGLWDDTSRVRPARPVEGDRADRDGLVTKEIRYHRVGASSVRIVWGVDGWNPVPPEGRPRGTEVRNSLMDTPMVKWGDDFVVNLRIPWRHRLDYGFLATESTAGPAVWDGDYQIRANGDGVIWATARGQASPTTGSPVGGATLTQADTVRLVPVTVKYPATIAADVVLTWGINGWNLVPRAVGIRGTVIEKNLMKTPLTREGVYLVARIDVPQGAILDYGFTLNDRRGLFDYVTPVWERPKDHPRVEAGEIIVARGAPSAPDAIREIVDAWPIVVGAALGFAAVWAGVALVIGRLGRLRPRPVG
jgi:hypothetical protein